MVPRNLDSNGLISLLVSVQASKRREPTSAEHGWPAFGLLDVRTATPAANTANRVKTAMWARKMATHISRVMVLTRPEHEVTFAIKIILRVAGMDNAELIHDEAAVQSALDRALAEGEAS